MSGKKKLALALVWAAGLWTAGPGSLGAMANPETTLAVNGRAHFNRDGRLLEEFSFEPSPETPGSGAKFLHGGSSTGRTLALIAEHLYKTEVDPAAGFIFEPAGGGATTRAVLNGQYDWGWLSRPLLQWEKDAGLQTTPVALDHFLVLAHPDSGVETLSLEQLAAVYTGEITNWKDLGGPDRPIAVFGFHPLNGLYSAFFEGVLETVYGDDARYTPQMRLLRSDLEIYLRMGDTPGALGFTLASARRPGGRLNFAVLKINGVAPEPEALETNQYALMRPLSLLTKGPAAGPAALFLDLVLSEGVQASLANFKLLRAAGF